MADYGTALPLVDSATEQGTNWVPAMTAFPPVHWSEVGWTAPAYPGSGGATGPTGPGVPTAGQIWPRGVMPGKKI